MERDTNKPIDLVIPMVFPQDPAWQREYSRFHRGDATQSERFRSWGTEELLVKCCMRFMPWLRRIYILLAQESQVQEWMKIMSVSPSREEASPCIRIVFHREFMPVKHLPCFASPCVEMFLHKIPGLSECFIYGNDDMFPLGTLQPEDFFRTVRKPDGTSDILPCQRITDRIYPIVPNVFQRKCMYQQNMIGGPFGLQFTRTYPNTGHILAAIRKLSCEEVWSRHGDEITKHLSPLRRKDRSYNHYIYQLYQQYSGQYVEHRPPSHYVDQNTPTTRVSEIISDMQAGIVCLNDNENIHDWRQRAEIAKEAIADKLRTENTK